MADDTPYVIVQCDDWGDAHSGDVDRSLVVKQGTVAPRTAVRFRSVNPFAGDDTCEL